MCGISRGLQVRRNCWFAWLLRGPLPKTDWEADASHGVSRCVSHYWTRRCHLFNSPSEWDTVCVCSLACLRVVPAVGPKPLSASWTRLCLQKHFDSLKTDTAFALCLAFFSTSGHNISHPLLTKPGLWLSQTSPLLDPGCFNNRTLRGCRVTRSTNQQLGHMMRVGVYKTPVWLISHR